MTKKQWRMLFFHQLCYLAEPLDEAEQEWDAWQAHW